MTNNRTYNRLRARSDPKQRNADILAAAIDDAIDTGYQWITKCSVAKRANMSPSTVMLYGSMITLKQDVLRAAVEREILPIIRQGLGDSHPIVMDAPADLVERALVGLRRCADCGDLVARGA